MVQEKYCVFIYIYVSLKMNLIHLVGNLFLLKLQALIARLDKTKNELNRTKMEFSSIKLQAAKTSTRYITNHVLRYLQKTFSIRTKISIFL